MSVSDPIRPVVPDEPVSYSVEPAHYDVCLAWVTEDDAGFVAMLDEACRAHNLSLVQITPTNVERACQDLLHGKMSFSAFMDRASDESPEFEQIVSWAAEHAAYRINPTELARKSWDKAATHAAVSRVVPVPYTFFLPPYNRAPELPELDLSPLGPTFTIKPSHGGGGISVVVVATSEEQIEPARKNYPDDDYMLQARVVSAKLDDRIAWFRIIYAGGKIYPAWWDFDNRDYRLMTVAEESHYHLAELRSLTEAIAEVCQLDLFSTEITIDTEHQFVVVDYVNDPIDLTLQSKKVDGVPDSLVRFIAEDLVELIAARI